MAALHHLPVATFFGPIYRNFPSFNSLELARSTALIDFFILSASSARVMVGFSAKVSRISFDVFTLVSTLVSVCEEGVIESSRGLS